MEKRAGDILPAVSVVLIARTRGKKWKNIEDDVKLRVPSGGKRIRLAFNVNGPFHVNWSSLRIELHDLGAMEIGKDSLVSNWSQLGDPQISQSLVRCSIDLHLDPSRKRLQFRCKCNTVDGEELTFSSVTFRSSNSGTSHAERRKDGLTQVRVTEIDTSPSASPPRVLPNFTFRGNLVVEGQVKAVQFSTFSDSRLKENIEDLLDSLSRVVRLQGLKYSWRPGMQFSNNTNESTPESRIGFIAQHVAEQFPELVEETSDGFLTVAYAHFVPPIIEALKQQMNKLSQLGDAEAELRQLSASYSQLVSELSSSQNTSTTPVSQNPRRGFFNSSPRRKETILSRFRSSLTSSNVTTRIAAISIPLVVLLVVILGLSLGMSNHGIQQGPQAPRAAAVPVRTINYVSDGGFEDPDSNLWTGNFSTASYSTSMWPPGALMKSLAPFNAQDRFLLLNSTSPTNSAFASQRFEAIPSSPFNLSVWCYIAAPTSTDAVVALSIDFETAATRFVYSLNQDSCLVTAYADLQKVGSWQLLQVFSTCNWLSPGDSLVVTLSISKAEAIVAFDFLTLELVPGLVPVRNTAFGLAGSSEFSIPDFVGSTIIAFTSFFDLNGAFYVGIVDLDSLRIGVVKHSQIDLDLSYGNSGIVWTEFIRMDDEHGTRSMVADGFGRVIVAGAAPAAFGLPSAAIARFNYDGTRDSTFGNSGTVHLAIPDAYSKPTRVVCASLYWDMDETIVTLWHFSYENGTHASFAARILSSGAMDRTFGSAGLVILPPELSQPVALSQDDTYLCIAAISSNSIQLAQLSASGIINADWITSATPAEIFFNASSISRTQLMRSYFSGYIVASTVLAPQPTLGLARFHANGSVDTAFGSNGSSLVIPGSLINCVVEITDDIVCILSNQSRSFFVSIFPNGQMNQAATSSLVRYSLVGPVDGFITTGITLTTSGDLWFFATSFNKTIRVARRWLQPQLPPAWSSQLVLPTRPTSTQALVIDTNVPNRILVGAQNLHDSFAISAILSDTGDLDSSFGQGRGFIVAKGSSSNDRIQLQDVVPLIPGLAIAYTISNSSSNSPFIVLERRWPDGAVDQLFRCNLSPSRNVSRVKIRLISAGRLYVCALTTNATEFIIWRIQADGSIDPSWNSGTPQIVTAAQLASSRLSPHFDVGTTSSDSLFIIGATQTGDSSSAFVLKFTPLGSRDVGFGIAGLAQYLSNGSSSGLTRVAIGVPSSPSHMYLAGWKTTANSTSAVVLKVSAALGALDPTFGEATLITAANGAEISIERLIYDSNSSSIAAFGVASTSRTAKRAFVATLDPILGTSGCSGPTSVSWLEYVTSNVAGALEIGGSYLVATDVGTAVRLTSFLASGQRICSTVCSNAILEAGEECDDGNRFGGDGCSATCRVELST